MSLIIIKESMLHRLKESAPFKRLILDPGRDGLCSKQGLQCLWSSPEACWKRIQSDILLQRSRGHVLQPSFLRKWKMYLGCQRYNNALHRSNCLIDFSIIGIEYNIFRYFIWKQDWSELHDWKWIRFFLVKIDFVILLFLIGAVDQWGCGRRRFDIMFIFPVHQIGGV